MDAARLVKTSKYLSKHLRHEPERLGLSLQPGGWVEVESLLTACRDHGFAITRDQLDQVVRDNDKQRFAIDASGTRIRANQGHSIAVDLELEPQLPPDQLFHGTGVRSVPAIQTSGLQRMARHHVHLSADLDTARRVGARHGRPAVFSVAAGRLHADGAAFYRSANGVWLVEAVPPHYLEWLDAVAGSSTG